MLLLISDANILIDMEAGKLLEKLFQLPFNFAIPDILYWEEIEPETQGLEALGLKVLEVRGEFVDYVFAMQSKYGEAPSTASPTYVIKRFSPAFEALASHYK